MSEENVRKKMAVPWVSFGSDAPALAPEGVFLRSHPHPRAYGTFARVLGSYVRQENIIPLEAAIHRMTGLPARTLGLRRRGLLQPGYFADLVIFDPNREQTISALTHQMRVDYSAYEGWKVRGVTETVLSRGKVIVENGEWRGKAGDGRFIKRGTFV